MHRVSCGFVTAYDRSFDRVSTINTKPLRPTTRISHTLTSSTTSDDPKIREVRPRGATHAARGATRPL